MKCIRGNRRNSADNPPPSLSSAPSNDSLPTDYFFKRRRQSFFRRSFQVIRSSVYGRRTHSKSWSCAGDLRTNHDKNLLKIRGDDQNNNSGSRLGFDDLGYFTSKKKKNGIDKPSQIATYDVGRGFSTISSAVDILPSAKKFKLKWPHKKRQRRR